LKEVSEMLRSGDSNEEDVDLLMWNVLEEIAPRSASASSDRHACEMIEALFPKMSALQLRFFVSKMEGYFSHLWTNRYSSHVLQNLLSRCNVIIEQEISGLDENCEENDRATDTPTMTTIIINMVQELQEEWGTLMNDVSASHVWRSVFAVLAGKPLMPEKRGKNGKHRAISFGKAPNITYSVPESFGNLFAQVLNALMNAPADVLNNLMYDRNSGPVISMALKFAPKDLQQELIQHILEWKNEKKSSKTFYNFAGDSVTSHFLEAVRLTSNITFCHKLNQKKAHFFFFFYFFFFNRCLKYVKKKNFLFNYLNVVLKANYLSILKIP
jgi:nucleolar protein 9